jgi:thymidylate kinase
MKVVVDGNIGSGKTTQLGLLEKKGFVVFREPIDEWPLQEFYEDPKNGIFPLHMAILRTLRPRGPGVYERSLLSSRWVFWEWAKTKGSAPHDGTYNYFYDRHGWQPDLYIFLSKSPEKCFEAIQTRGQTGDSFVTLEYLKELDALYQKLVMKVPCRVHILKADAPPEEIHEKILNILSHNEYTVLVGDGERRQVQKPGSHGGSMLCPPFQDLCRLS